MSNDPMSEPMLATERMSPKRPSPPQRSSASLGSETW
jgi:hypothetical protein